MMEVKWSVGLMASGTWKELQAGTVALHEKHLASMLRCAT